LLRGVSIDMDRRKVARLRLPLVHCFSRVDLVR